MAYAIPVEAYEEHLNCSICMEMFHDPRALPCLHTFCLTCLHSYVTSLATRSNISDGFECPVCRADIPPPRRELDLPVENWAESYPPNYTVKGLVDEATREATRHIDAVTSGINSCGVKCGSHAVKDADFFCKDHDTNCCSMCAALKHRKCKTLVYLGNLSDSSAHSDGECSDTGTRPTGDIAGDDIAASGRVHEHKVLSRVSRHRKFAGQGDERRDSTDVLAEDFNRAVVIVGCTSETTFINELGEIIEKVADGTVEGEQNGHTIDPAMYAELNGASGAVNTRVPTALELEQAVQDLEMCASLPETLLCQSRFILDGKYSVSVPDDTTSCYVTGMAALPDGRVLLVDANNSRIKMFTNTCDYITHTKLPWQPFGIASLSEKEVVVSFPTPMFLQIVLIRDRYFVSDRVIQLPKPGFGVACFNEEIYVVLEDEIRIIDNTGVTLSIFPKDKNTFMADPVLKNARHIAVSKCENDHGATVYVTDNEKGSLTCVNRIGKYMSFTDYEVAQPTSIAVVSSGSLFVCSAQRRLLQIRIVEKGALTKTAIEISKIQYVHVNEYDNKLWVACHNGDGLELCDSRPTTTDADVIIYQGIDTLM